MAMNAFVWFVVTLLVTVSNIVLSVFVYSFLSVQKKLSKELKLLKEIAILYAIGMIAALIAAVSLLFYLV